MLPDLARVLDEAQARQLPALIADWSDLRARRWIARALRIDLALLTAEPELVIPCLYRRCVWPGSEREAAYYRQRPPVPDDALAVRSIMEEWAVEWGSDRRWLRALRPPEVAVDGGVVEEYRTSLPGALRVDRDHVAIAGAITWERATGRRIEPLPAVVPRASWRATSSAGQLVLVSPGRSVAIEHRTDAMPDAVFALSDRFVVVAADGPQYWLIDLERAQIQWESVGLCTAAVVDDPLVYIASPTRIEARDLATGTRRGAFNAPPPSELVVAGDGQLATRSGDVIRVWNVHQAMRRNSSAQLGEPELFGPAIATTDGVMRVGDAAIPVDRASLQVSPDQRYYASLADHLELVQVGET
ncbi:MAG TPA: hypothetical protein VIU61_29075 [Kofleriaceae bacterium]